MIAEMKDYLEKCNIVKVELALELLIEPES